MCHHYNGCRSYRLHLCPSSTKAGQEPLLHVPVAVPEAKIPYLSTFLHAMHTQVPGDPNCMHSIVQSFFMEKKQKIMSRIQSPYNLEFPNNTKHQWYTCIYNKWNHILVIGSTHHRTLSGWLPTASWIWPSLWPTRNTWAWAIWLPPSLARRFTMVNTLQCQKKIGNIASNPEKCKPPATNIIYSQDTLLLLILPYGSCNIAALAQGSTCVKLLLPWLVSILHLNRP